MIGPLDEFPLHQAAQPLGWPASSDRNFYDRNYFNAMQPGTDAPFFIAGIGFYPNLQVKDAFAIVGDGATHKAVHFSDEIGVDRLDQYVGNFRLEVIKPLHELRLVTTETHGFAFDLTWRGSFPVIQEMPHVMRNGPRVTLDAQRFAQVGSWEGVISVDGTDIVVTPDTWLGSRDRSWGIRPVGEPETPGRPQDPPVEGFWWMYVPMRFDDFAICVIMQESPDGTRTLNDCSRVYADGRVEQLGWPRMELTYKSGTRVVERCVLNCTALDGSPVTIDIVPETGIPLHIGGGYGGDSDWSHGMWKGAGFTERRDYDLTDPDVSWRIPFGVTDYVASAVCTDKTGIHQGHGLFEHASVGRHDPTGFLDYGSVAP